MTELPIPIEILTGAERDLGDDLVDGMASARRRPEINRGSVLREPELLVVSNCV
jgi:hypothetical protein